MIKTLLIYCCSMSLLQPPASAQTDFLVLRKAEGRHVRSYHMGKGRQILTYTVGDELNCKTKYNQWFKGRITDMRHDSVFLNGEPWNYTEIVAIKRFRKGSSLLMLGTAMMSSGTGFLALGAINGARRGDQFHQWYSASGVITSAILMVGGFFVARAFFVKYKIGKRYSLDYVSVHS